jgi:hypothetical protein
MIRMAIQVVLVDEAAGGRDVHEIVQIDRGRLCPKPWGYLWPKPKRSLAASSRLLAGAQVAEWQEGQRAPTVAVGAR